MAVSEFLSISLRFWIVLRHMALSVMRFEGQLKD